MTIWAMCFIWYIKLFLHINICIRNLIYIDIKMIYLDIFSAVLKKIKLFLFIIICVAAKFPNDIFWIVPIQTLLVKNFRIH